MRSLLVLGAFLVGSAAFAQTPAATAPAAPVAPAAPAVRRPAAAAPAARSGMAITVTDPRGTILPGIHADVLGGSDRNGDTSANGQLNFTAMQAGTYRLRFTGDAVIPFEKEVTLRPAQIADIDIMLNPAPKAPEPVAPPPPPPAPPPPAPVVGPAGQPQTISIVDLVERELIAGNQPRRETLVSCSGNTRSTLVQLNQDQPQRLYEEAEVAYYVVAGEGAVRISGRDTALVAGSFVSLPRGTAHVLVRRGRRPLILLATLSGEPCEQPR
ncbi:MAG: cupin domain-containing protein [Acidobacteria bacterium]|nr:cupin domain-containing protein [Acidobacteriota bacterium]